jgi:hypothetical protein
MIKIKRFGQDIALLFTTRSAITSLFVSSKYNGSTALHYQNNPFLGQKNSTRQVAVRKGGRRNRKQPLKFFGV